MHLLTASWVVPVSAPPLRHGRVAVQDGRIVWVGPPGGGGEPAGELRDLGPGVLLPGLVNAHCHLELSYLHRRLDCSRGFVPWVEQLVEARSGEDLEAVRRAVAAAIRELDDTGTVAVGDVSNALAHLDLLEASPVEAVVFYELLGWDPEGAEAILDEARRRMAAARHGRAIEVRLAAHAPHSVSLRLLEALAAEGGPASLHLAESPAEAEFIRAGHGEWGAFLGRRRQDHVPFEPSGRSPVAYADDHGLLGPGRLAVHCVQVGRADVERLARSGANVVLCPRSNRNLKVGLPPLPELIAAGVRLSLGTDSLASVDSLDLMEEVRTLAEEFPAIPLEQLFAMATSGGAEALGRPELGALAPGRRAALVHAAAPADPADPWEFLLSRAARPRRVA